MAWTVIKIDEQGREEKKLSDEFEILNFDGFDLSQFKVIKYLDPYGDMTFGSRQFDDLLADLRQLEKMNRVESKQITEPLELINECKNQVYTYIKFYGD